MRISLSLVPLICNMAVLFTHIIKDNLALYPMLAHTIKDYKFNPLQPGVAYLFPLKTSEDL